MKLETLNLNSRHFERLTYYLDKELFRLKKDNLHRVLRAVESPQSPEVIIEGKRFLLLSSNNYLGLANHPYIKKKSVEALKKYGTGSGASRLISGNTALSIRLKKKSLVLKDVNPLLFFHPAMLQILELFQALQEKMI